MNKSKSSDEFHEDLIMNIHTYSSALIDSRCRHTNSGGWMVSFMGESLLKVKRVYRNEGIVKAMDYAEPEDHISFELKFMHYLCEEELAIEKGERANWRTVERYIERQGKPRVDLMVIEII